MGKKEDGANNSRRNFLKFAAVSAPGIAVITATGTAVQASDLDEKSGGLRDTAHTKTYFETAGF